MDEAARLDCFVPSGLSKPSGWKQQAGCGHFGYRAEFLLLGDKRE
jgi:hypothetical protein